MTTKNAVALVMTAMVVGTFVKVSLPGGEPTLAVVVGHTVQQHPILAAEPPEFGGSVQFHAIRDQEELDAYVTPWKATKARREKLVKDVKEWTRKLINDGSPGTEDLKGQFGDQGNNAVADLVDTKATETKPANKEKQYDNACGGAMSCGNLIEALMGTGDENETDSE